MKDYKEMNVLLESELTETAPGGDGEHDKTGRGNFVPCSIQCNIETPCEHRFSRSVLRDLRAVEATKRNISAI